MENIRKKKNYKYIYSVCLKCGVDKNPNQSGWCRECSNAAARRKTQLKNEIKVSRKDIIKFVEKIERRNGLASIKDIYVDLITLHSHLRKGRELDHLEPAEQLQIMYSDLKKYINWKKVTF